MLPYLHISKFQFLIIIVKCLPEYILRINVGIASILELVKENRSAKPPPFSLILQA